MRAALRAEAESASASARLCRSLAAQLLDLAQATEGYEAAELEARACRLLGAASAESRTAIAAARALADEAIGQLAAEAEARRVDPVDLARRLGEARARVAQAGQS